MPPPPRTCSQLPVPGHEITALSLWKRLLPPFTTTLLSCQPTSTYAPCLLCHLACLPPAARSSARAGSSSTTPSSPVPFPSPREPPKIMLSEISIKRDSVRAGIRLNLSSYSTRGWKETFRAGERACPGFEMTCVYSDSLFPPFQSVFSVSALSPSLFDRRQFLRFSLVSSLLTHFPI